MTINNVCSLQLTLPVYPLLQISPCGLPYQVIFTIKHNTHRGQVYLRVKINLEWFTKAQDTSYDLICKLFMEE
jgi:hypothetical protein